MAEDNKITRLYFKTSDKTRKFYWVKLSNDGSVYFGSSDSKNYKKGYCGSTHIPIEGSYIDPANYGRTMDTDEIRDKHSLHNSGILILPEKEKGRRKRHQAIKLSDYNEPIPLVGILPMKVIKYPESRKNIRDHDIVMDVSALINQPFGLMIYLKYPSHPHPLAVKNIKGWDDYKFYSSHLGTYNLCAVLYANRKTFIKWQELEVTCISQPNPESKKLSWPIFGSSGCKLKKT